jgi:hypothetical protein
MKAIFRLDRRTMVLHEQKIDVKNAPAEFMAHQNQPKMNEQNGIDFSSNIDYAKQSISKLMDHRIERLFTMLDTSETQLNVSNISAISIERENEINESSENSCSSAIIVKSFHKIYKLNAILYSQFYFQNRKIFRLLSESKGFFYKI